MQKKKAVVDSPIQSEKELMLHVKRVGTDSFNQNVEENKGQQQGALPLGYSSKKEEGEILVLKGKEKLYESDTEQRSIIEEKFVRKSQRDHTRAQKLNL